MAGEIFDLYAEDNPLKQQAMVDALRRRIGGQQQVANFDRAWGSIGAAGGTDMIQRMAQQQNQNARMDQALAGQGEQQLAQAGEFKAGASLKRALEAAQSAERSKKTGLETEEGLRKELMGNPVTKATQDVATAWGRVQNASKDPSPAGDIALVYGFMKMMDPGSTVREGEFATAANAGGIPQQIVSMYNKALNGQRLAPEIRSDFLTKAQGLYGVQLDRYKALEKSFQGLAGGAGVDPARVAIPLGFEGGGDAAPVGRQEVRDKTGKIIGYINADGSEELVP